MKRLIPILGLLLFISPVHAAVSFAHSDAGACNNASGSGNMTTSCATPSVTHAFTYTPSVSGNAVLFFLACSDTAGTPSAVSLTGTGWTLTQVGAITGSTTLGWFAIFRAYAPNTTLVTMTQTWTASTCSNFMNDIVHEWSGADATNFVDASSLQSPATTCNSLTVTPVASNDGISFFCNDSVSAATSPYTVAGNDGSGDWGEQKVISGTGVQTAAFTASGTATGAGVAIKPAAAVGAATMPAAVY